MGNIQNFRNVYAKCSKSTILDGGQMEDGNILWMVKTSSTLEPNVLINGEISVVSYSEATNDVSINRFKCHLGNFANFFCWSHDFCY